MVEDNVENGASPVNSMTVFRQVVNTILFEVCQAIELLEHYD